MGQTIWIDLGTEAIIARFWSRADAVVICIALGVIALLSGLSWFFPAGPPTLSGRLVGPIIFISCGASIVALYLWVERRSVIATRLGVSDQSISLETRAAKPTEYSWHEPGFQVTVWDNAFDESGHRRTSDLGSHKVMIRLAANGRVQEFYSSWAAAAEILRRANAMGVPISKDRIVVGSELSPPVIELSIGSRVAQMDRRDPEEVRRLLLLS